MDLSVFTNPSTQALDDVEFRSIARINELEGSLAVLNLQNPENNALPPYQTRLQEELSDGVRNYTSIVDYRRSGIENMVDIIDSSDHGTSGLIAFHAHSENHGPLTVCWLWSWVEKLYKLKKEIKKKIIPAFQSCLQRTANTSELARQKRSVVFKYPAIEQNKMPYTPSTYPRLTKEEFYAAVGNTPLVKFESLSNEIGRNIFFKAEYTNPGKSIKDRPACYLLDSALSSGKLTPGGTLAEATAGNTGLALALLARSYDPPFKVRLFVPDVLIQDKITLLESVGCTVIKCPSDVSATDPLFFNNQAMQYAEDNENTAFVNQMANTANRRAHYENTGPEIWKQLEGKVDGFTASAGTGGTLNGVSSYLKEKSGGKTVCWAADRFGSGLCSYVKTHGESWESEGTSFVEGIGKKSLTGQMDDTLELVDGAITITDTDALVTCYTLFAEQGVWIGPSAALNICAARELAKTLPQGSNVVTTAADYADNYASKMFNKAWLIENGHWDHIPEELRKYATYE